MTTWSVRIVRELSLPLFPQFLIYTIQMLLSGDWNEMVADIFYI